MTSKPEGMAANHLILSGETSSSDVELIYPITGTLVVEYEISGVIED